MSVEVKVALISGAVSIVTSLLTLVGVVISNNKSKSDMQKQLEIGQAVTNTKIEGLTREVREHNGFAKRMPVVEEKINVANHRIEDLEAFHKPHANAE